MLNVDVDRNNHNPQYQTLNPETGARDKQRRDVDSPPLLTFPPAPPHLSGAYDKQREMSIEFEAGRPYRARMSCD